MTTLRGLERYMMRVELSDRVAKVVNGFALSLDGRERDILKLRWLQEPPVSLEQIGQRHGCCRERCRQVEERMIARLAVVLRAVLNEEELSWLGVAAPAVGGGSPRGAPRSSPAEGVPFQRAARRPRAPRAPLI